MPKRFIVQVAKRTEPKYRTLRPAWAKKAKPAYTFGYRRAKAYAALQRRLGRKTRIRVHESEEASLDALVMERVVGNTKKMNRELLHKIALTMQQVGPDARFRIHSGYRDPADQQRLYNLFLQGKGAPANAPGTSLHERGLAVDGSVGGVNFWYAKGVRKIAEKNGLWWRYAHEPWHIEKR